MSSWSKGPASDPMHTRDHWLDLSCIYISNLIKEGLGHESDHTFRGALVMKSGILRLHPLKFSQSGAEGVNIDLTKTNVLY